MGGQGMRLVEWNLEIRAWSTGYEASGMEPGMKL